jgi:hypothetical protein
MGFFVGLLLFAGVGGWLDRKLFGRTPARGPRS